MFKILNFIAGFISKKLIVLPFAFIFLTALISYSLWIFSVIYNVYKQIDDLSQTLVNAGVSDPSNLLCKIFGLLDCMGFWDGVGDGMLSLIPAITFYITAVSARLFIAVQSRLVKLLVDMTS